jgi:hypothetical protein
MGRPPGNTWDRYRWSRSLYMDPESYVVKRETDDPPVATSSRRLGSSPRSEPRRFLLTHRVMLWQQDDLTWRAELLDRPAGVAHGSFKET